MFMSLSADARSSEGRSAPPAHLLSRCCGSTFKRAIRPDRVLPARRPSV